MGNQKPRTVSSPFSFTLRLHIDPSCSYRGSSYLNQLNLDNPSQACPEAYLLDVSKPSQMTINKPSPMHLTTLRGNLSDAHFPSLCFIPVFKVPLPSLCLHEKCPRPLLPPHPHIIHPIGSSGVQKARRILVQV